MKPTIHEQATAKALEKVLTFTRINLKRKIADLLGKLKSKKITNDKYLKLKNEIKKDYQRAATSYGHMIFQIDPAHAGQTMQKVSSILF